MTLDQLADYVCTKSGLTDTAAVTACKTFLSKRYELIYNSYLWKDSLIGVDITVDPTTNDDNAEGVVFIPEVIDRVVAVRTTDRSVQVRGLEDYYRIDYDKFAQTGTPYEFALLPPAWFTWRADAGQSSIYFSGPVDTWNLKLVYTNQNGVRTVTTADLDPNEGERITLTGTKIVVESVFKKQQDANATIPVSDANNITVVSLPDDAPVRDASGQLISLATSDTRSPKYQRLRIFNIPDASLTLSVLGKKKFIPLDFDTEEPEISNLDNCLIAFGMADMLEYGRRVGQAQTFKQEGAILLQELAKLETVQAAHNSRFIPENGMGDPFFGPSHNAGLTTGVF